MFDTAGSCGILYQLYTTENSYKCTVILTDETTGKEVAKNTAIVLVICIIIGIFIWAIDFGLAELLKLIWSK